MRILYQKGKSVDLLSPGNFLYYNFYKHSFTPSMSFITFQRYVDL